MTKASQVGRHSSDQSATKQAKRASLARRTVQCLHPSDQMIEANLLRIKASNEADRQQREAMLVLRDEIRVIHGNSS